MPFRTTTPSSLNYNKSSPGASSTGLEFPKSPSLNSDRQRSAFPRKNSFSEKKSQIIDLLSPCSPHTPVNIKPYIGLRSKLSLAWVNYTVVALIFIILRLFIAIKSIGPIVDEVKGKALRTCDALEVTTSTVTESIKVLGDFTNGRLNDIKNQLNTDMSCLNSALDKIRDAVRASPINHIPSISIPTDSLNVQLPTSNIVNGLDSLISVPFNGLQGLINDSMSNVKFNQTALPVPPKNQISFCTENLDLSVLNNIACDLIKAAYIGLGIIFIVVLLMIACNAIVVWFSHKRYKLHISRTTTTIKMLTIKADKDSVIEVLKVAEHPLISRWIIKCSKYFKNLENRNLFRWFFDYIFHKPALICLLIGLVGVMGIYLQIGVLHVVTCSHDSDRRSDSVRSGTIDNRLGQNNRNIGNIRYNRYNRYICYIC